MANAFGYQMLPNLVTLHGLVTRLLVALPPDFLVVY
jgi:hypothetical protein